LNETGKRETERARGTRALESEGKGPKPALGEDRSLQRHSLGVKKPGVIAFPGEGGYLKV